jgi:hypothetical protein
MKSSIRLVSDIQAEDVFADSVAAIRVDNFQVIVRRDEVIKGIEICIFNNGLPFHLNSMEIDENDSLVMHIKHGE